jgi:beta-glucosidase
VAQVYVGENAPKVMRPSKELKAYEKVFLKKGEKKHVELVLDKEAFEYWDIQTHAFVVNPGDFTISVGRSVKDIKLSSLCKVNM